MLYKVLIVYCILLKVFQTSIKADNIQIDSLKSLLYIDSIKGNMTESFFIYKRLAYESDNPYERIKYSDMGYEIAKRAKQNSWMAAILAAKAQAFSKIGELDKAITLLLNSRDLYLLENRQDGVLTSFLLLADIYQNNNEINKAIQCYEYAVEGFRMANDSVRYLTTLLNKGELYRKDGLLQEALNCFYITDLLFNKFKHIYGIAYSKGNIGLVYTAQNKLDSAEIYLNKSIEILEPLGDNYAVSSYLDGLAEVYFKRKQYSKAKKTAHKSLLLAQEHGLKEQIRDASLRLSTIYNQSKDFEKAFFHHKQYVAYRDSINNEETIRKIANLHTKYEVAQKQKEVDEEKAYKNRYLIIAICAISVLILLTVLVFIILKISRERRKTNLILEQQRKELENANATKNKFFSILSHDLRSPLATFHSYAEVIEICSEHNDVDKLLILGKELKSSSASMLDLLDNLLQWGVNQMGDQQSVPTTVNLKDVATLEVDHLKHVSNKKNINVSINIQPSVTLFVDRVNLSIALRNLINNAIKFTPAGGSVAVSAEYTTLHTILKISDTGVGMTQEQKDKLFDFNKINSTYGTQNEKGVGLGMQLVCGFVKENNAKLHVETELGKGTTFAIVFEKKEKSL